MGFIFYEPRKRSSSSEPRITMGEKFISINKPALQFFKDKEYAKIGYDKIAKKIIFIPMTKSDRQGMKIISNEKWEHGYINAKNIFGDILPAVIELKGRYKCSWDDINKGILVDIEKDKIK